jgi:hypothetical protein
MASVKAAASAEHPPQRRGGQAARGSTKGIDRSICMGLILLEALLALVVLIAIVWWTMFAGRKKGELPPSDDPPT